MTALLVAVFMIVELAGLGQVPRRPDGATATLLPWSEAVRLWKRHDEGPAFHLARGVLFECAGHSTGRAISFGPAQPPPIGGERSCRAADPVACRRFAETAFANAAADDDAPVEATLRLAWSRIERAGRASTRELEPLETVAGSETTPTDLRFLAAMFLGKAASLAARPGDAASWFETAVGLMPRAGSAQLALAAASENHPALDLWSGGANDLDSDVDPWYSYRCQVLTPDIREALDGWILRAQAGNRE